MPAPYQHSACVLCMSGCSLPRPQLVKGLLRGWKGGGACTRQDISIARQTPPNSRWQARAAQKAASAGWPSMGIKFCIALLASSRLPTLILSMKGSVLRYWSGVTCKDGCNARQLVMAVGAQADHLAGGEQTNRVVSKQSVQPAAMPAPCMAHDYDMFDHTNAVACRPTLVVPCTQMARSLVMWPSSTVRITAASMSVQNLSSSGRRGCEGQGGVAKQGGLAAEQNGARRGATAAALPVQSWNATALQQICMPRERLKAGRAVLRCAARHAQCMQLKRWGDQCSAPHARQCPLRLTVVAVQLGTVREAAGPCKDGGNGVGGGGVALLELAPVPRHGACTCGGTGQQHGGRSSQNS